MGTVVDTWKTNQFAYNGCDDTHQAASPKRPVSYPGQVLGLGRRTCVLLSACATLIDLPARSSASPLLVTVTVGGKTLATSPFNAPTSLSVSLKDLNSQSMPHNSRHVPHHPTGINGTWSVRWNTPVMPDSGDCGCAICKGAFEEIDIRMDGFIRLGLDTLQVHVARGARAGAVLSRAIDIALKGYILKLGAHFVQEVVYRVDVGADMVRLAQYTGGQNVTYSSHLLTSGTSSA
ncbi:hypothetical protein LXA43DRAFT_1104464 [Ganoderma leucocontextum]|nr:hypothetical protein LXA43DRAFT_1104464 [Ganoderma leucocontextum]